MKKTKIIATIGPASFSRKALKKMTHSGMDAGRLNFSHGNHEEFSRLIQILRDLEVDIIGDLQGHRIRVGELEGEIELRKNMILRVSGKEKKGTEKEISIDYPGPMENIKKGNNIFIDDGKICLEVTEVSESIMETRVVKGGILKENKGVNIPEADLDFGGLSDKDRRDIRFCREHKIDYVAQSFVKDKGDVADVKKELGEESECGVIAKIECRGGIKNIDSIIEASDGIMIARGDMGISLPVYEIPVMQKMIIKKCNRALKPVITATQMLDSMTENETPTRAEVSDVANAIIDGSDYVMLSGETSIGKNPVKTVDMMNKVIKFTEEYLRNSG